VKRRCLAGCALAALLLPAPAEAVIGGHPADIASWGFTVALREHKSFFCTGSVISPTLVLTAAHCVRNRGLRKLRVVTGREHLRNSGDGEVLRVADVHRFPNYRKKERHDLAVVRLRTPTAVPPIPLATAAEAEALTRPGTKLYVAGYGDTHPLFSVRPRYGRLTAGTEVVRTNGRCRRAYRHSFRAYSMICALGHRFGHKPIGSTTCFGDSGGPLIGITPDGPRLLGVTSFAGIVGNIACGAQAKPSVYARVSTATHFVKKLLGD
jgi:trypsin